MPTIYNKVTIDGTTLLDLSQDTVADASHIRQGYTGHLNDGTQVTGTYSGGGGGSWMGANPTKVQTYADEKVFLKDTAFATWTPSTSQSTIVNGTNFTSYSCDASYDYYVINKWHTHFEYNGSQTANYINDFYSVCAQSVYGCPNTSADFETNTKGKFEAIAVTTRNILDYITGTGAKAITTNSYGLYPTFLNPTVSGVTTMTAKSPTIYARCNNTYLSTTSAGYINKDTSYYELTIELWKVDSGTSAAGALVNDVYSMWEDGEI